MRFYSLGLCLMRARLWFTKRTMRMFWNLKALIAIWHLYVRPELEITLMKTKLTKCSVLNPYMPSNCSYEETPKECNRVKRRRIFLAVLIPLFVATLKVSYHWIIGENNLGGEVWFAYFLFIFAPRFREGALPFVVGHVVAVVVVSWLVSLLVQRSRTLTRKPSSMDQQ